MFDEVRQVWHFLVDGHWLLRGLVGFVPGIVLAGIALGIVIAPVREEWFRAQGAEALEWERLERDLWDHASLQAAVPVPSDSDLPRRPDPGSVQSRPESLATSLPFIAQIAEASGLRLERLQPESGDADSTRASGTYSVRMFGGFGPLLDFLERLHRHTVAVGVDEWVIEASPGVDVLTFAAVLHLSGRESR